MMEKTINNGAFLVKGDVLSGRYFAYFKTIKPGVVVVKEFRDFEEYSSETISEEDI